MTASDRAQTNDDTPATLAFIGFGEAAMAFVSGWDGTCANPITAFDIKTDAPAPAVRKAKKSDYAAAGVTGARDLAEALASAEIVFSVVTPDQAFNAATGAAAVIAPGALYFDCNSCAPETKRQVAGLIGRRGARYVDVAVMSPVHPRLHKTPLLISGDHAAAGLQVLNTLDMKATITPGPVGAASSIKMIRSVMVKGMEALVLECVLSGRRAGVDEIVLQTLKDTFPGFDWDQRAAYMMERVMTHGLRRSQEMGEVAQTVDDLGLSGDMARGSAAWQQRVGALELDAEAIGAGDYQALADAILRAIGEHEQGEIDNVTPLNASVAE